VNPSATDACVSYLRSWRGEAQQVAECGRRRVSLRRPRRRPHLSQPKP